LKKEDRGWNPYLSCTPSSSFCGQNHEKLQKYDFAVSNNKTPLPTTSSGKDVRLNV